MNALSNQGRIIKREENFRMKRFHFPCSGSSKFEVDEEKRQTYKVAFETTLTRESDRLCFECASCDSPTSLAIPSSKNKNTSTVNDTVDQIHVNFYFCPGVTPANTTSGFFVFVYFFFFCQYIVGIKMYLILTFYNVSFQTFLLSLVFYFYC